MRHLRTPVGLIAIVCAFAVTAAPALAKEFVASKLGNTRGTNVGTQEFKFGIFKITCEHAGEKGSVTALTSKTLYDVVKLGRCVTEAKIGGKPFFLKTTFRTPVDFEYHANGFTETGAESESEVALVAAGAVEVKVAAIKCVITWPAQTVPLKAERKPEEEYSSVLYSNEEAPTTRLGMFPTGFQKKLLISNELKGMEYSYTEGQCEEYEKEGKSATYKGTLRDELVGGDLSIQ